MKKIIIFIAVILFAQNIHIQKADKYLKIGSQTAIYDAANEYYKAKEYKKAINLYQKINKPNLKFNTLYNMANAYAYSGNLQKAKEALIKALKIKKDKDAEYNLKLIEKLLKKHKNKSQNKKNKQKKSKNQNKNQSQKNHNAKQNKKKQNNKNTNSHKNNKQYKNNKQNKNQKSKENKKTTKLKKENKTAQKEKIKIFKPTNKKTSDIRKKYYEMKLKNLNFNTLLLPLRSN